VSGVGPTVVVMTVHPISAGAGEFELQDEQLFGTYEQELFSRVVTVAEREGKPVELLVVPASDPFGAMCQAAATLKASRLVISAVWNTTCRAL
jgi:hypothetical protein